MNLFLGTVSRNEFDSLKESMQIYQNNIDNNITWFYAALAIVVAILIVGLIVIVRSSISAGIEKGINHVDSTVRKEISQLRNDIDERITKLIKKNRQIKWASGNITISGQDNTIIINGLDIDRDILKVVPLSIEISLKPIGGGKYTTEAFSYNLSQDGVLFIKISDDLEIQGQILFWEIIWIEITGLI
jgi:hypothetical protein